MRRTTDDDDDMVADGETVTTKMIFMDTIDSRSGEFLFGRATPAAPQPSRSQMADHQPGYRSSSDQTVLDAQQKAADARAEWISNLTNAWRRRP